MTTRTYCTILSSNYLPKALALGESLRRHEDGAILKIFFIDIAHDADLPTLPGVECLSTEALGLPDRTVLTYTMGYELVEFATSVKPLLLKVLLQDAEQAVYLDPDTFVTSPMLELGPALEASPGGILVTPHFLRPPEPGAHFGEGHLLLVGVNNLGFCAVDRRAVAFLDWWWGHLQSQCLVDPLSGLFVDQKWVDIGASFFQATTFRHSGYNVSLANLAERPLGVDEDGYSMITTGERLRLYHFHAFDPHNPETLSMRFRSSKENPLGDEDVVLRLCKEYAETLIGYEQSLPPAPPYPYLTDTKGRNLPKKIRRVYLREALRSDHQLPSPFLTSDAAEWERWRRRARRPISRSVASEVAKSMRLVFPDEYNRMKKRFPKLANKMIDRYAGGDGMWG